MVFFLIHVCFSDPSLFPPVLTIRPNDNATLRCNITGHEEVAWYLLSSDNFTLLISAEKTRTRKILPVHYNKDENHFILEPDSEVNTAIFTIIAITTDDLGLYFCGIKATFGDQMHFKKVTRLQFEGLCYSVFRGLSTTDVGALLVQIILFPVRNTMFLGKGVAYLYYPGMMGAT